MKKLTLLATLGLLIQSHTAFAGKVHDRVMKNETIRCGYVNFEPWFSQSPNDNKKSGIFYDISEAIGRKLHLDIEWVQETGFGSFVADINNNRFDMLCSGSWKTPHYAKHVTFGRPAFYMPVYAITRYDDQRFKNNNPDRINKSDVTVVTLDGDIAGFIQGEDFPKAKLKSLTNLTEVTQLLLEISSGKADVTFQDPDVVNRFIAKNPKSVAIMQSDYPIRLYPTSTVFASGDVKFEHMINAAIEELIFTGEINRILKKHSIDPNAYLQVSVPHK